MSVRRRRRPRRRTPFLLPIDLAFLFGFALLLLPAWLAGERYWLRWCRWLTRLPGLTNTAELSRNSKNLAAALGADRGEATAIALRQKAMVFELILQDLRAWRPGGWQPEIAIEGAAHLEAALAKGKGVVLWVAPFLFNGLIAKMALSRLGHRTLHLSSEVHGYSRSRFARRFLNAVRIVPETRYADRIVFARHSRATTMRQMMRAVRAGGIVSIVATSTLGTHTVNGPVLNGTVRVAVGAPRLAMATGARLVPVFTVRERDGRYRVVIEPPLDLGAAPADDARLADAVGAFMRRSEPWIRAYPDQWRAWRKWHDERALAQASAQAPAGAEFSSQTRTS